MVVSIFPKKMVLTFHSVDEIRPKVAKGGHEMEVVDKCNFKVEICPCDHSDVRDLLDSVLQSRFSYGVVNYSLFIPNESCPQVILKHFL